jgi:hypothetical protein
MAHTFFDEDAPQAAKKAPTPPSPLSNSKQVSKYLAGAASGFVSCRPGFYYVLPLALIFIGAPSLPASSQLRARGAPR